MHLCDINIVKLQNTFYTKDKIISLGFSVYTALWPACMTYFLRGQVWKRVWILVASSENGCENDIFGLK